MHPADTYPNPSPRPRRVLSLSMPAPQHTSAPSFAVPAEGSGNCGGGGARSELGGTVPEDVRYAHLGAGPRFQQEQVPETGSCVSELGLDRPQYIQ